MPSISSIEMRRLSYSLGSLLSIEEVLECSRKLNEIKPEVMWIPETWGMENFSMLGLVSQENKFSQIGSSIINIYSRSPSLIAMGATTIDTISNGRLILGLGTSSVPIIEGFHGQSFISPVQRMREYVEIIRLAISGEKINYSGKIFSLKDFSILVKPLRKKIPIYLAAINQKMVELTWDCGDGVIFYLRPKDEMKKMISIMQKKRKIDTSLQIITCVDHDSEKAINRAKKTLSFYIAVGTIYREFLQSNGYSKETEIIYSEYKKGGLKNLEAFIPDEMLDDLCIAGTPDIAIKKLNAFREIGIELPIIQFNPIGNVKESFQLLTDTFSGEINE